MSVQSENIPRNFFANNIQFKDTQQGKYERQCVLSDEDLRSRASQWVRENAFKKGKSNMTSPMFCEYVNNDLLLVHHLSQHFPRTISLYTAVHWLHQLGFKPVSHKKGVYIDGHKREDVVKHRKEFLTNVKQLQETQQPPPSCGGTPSRYNLLLLSLASSLHLYSIHFLPRTTEEACHDLS